jgi:Tol biopolymer transport system component
VPAAPPDNDISAIDGWASDVTFSPDESQLVVSQCNEYGVCATSLVGVQSAMLVRTLPDLEDPHPSFSPDGSWIVAGGTLLHLASGDVRSLDPGVKPTAALFTPEGDIIAGSDGDVLTRYCRNP